MHYLISWAILVLGMWTVVSPWVIGTQRNTVMVAVIAGGASVILLSLLSIRIKSSRPKVLVPPAARSEATRYWQTETDTRKTEPEKETAGTKEEGMDQGLCWRLVAAGLFIFALGVVFWAEALGFSCLITGIIIALLSGIMLQISTQPGTVKLFARDGSVLMEASTIDWADGCVTVKGKVLGSMPMTAYFKPDEMWKSLGLISPAVLLHLPVHLYRGWRMSKKQRSRQSRTIE